MAAEDLREKLRGLRGQSSVRLVYRCGECAYTLHKTAFPPEVESLLDRWREETRLRCDHCGAPQMAVSQVHSEEEWKRKTPFFVQGG